MRRGEVICPRAQGQINTEADPEFKPCIKQLVCYHYWWQIQNADPGLWMPGSSFPHLTSTWVQDGTWHPWWPWQSWVIQTVAQYFLKTCLPRFSSNCSSENALPGSQALCKPLTTRGSHSIPKHRWGSTQNKPPCRQPGFKHTSATN